MNKSPEVKNIAAALAKAQAQIKGASKDSMNPHLKSKYADLASCWDACRDALTSNGIAVVQANHSDRDDTGKMGLYVTTMLLHTSGEFLEETCEIPLSKTDAQGVGSAITYGRRYGLCAMVGISPEDDDGEGAVSRNERGESKPAPARKPRTESKPIPEHVALARSEFKTFCRVVAKETDRALDGVEAETAAQVRDRFGIKTLDDLTVDQASQLIDYFEVEREALREPAHA